MWSKENSGRNFRSVPFIDPKCHQLLKNPQLYPLNIYFNLQTLKLPYDRLVICTYKTYHWTLYHEPKKGSITRLKDLKIQWHCYINCRNARFACLSWQGSPISKTRTSKYNSHIIYISFSFQTNKNNGVLSPKCASKYSELTYSIKRKIMTIT